MSNRNLFFASLVFLIMAISCGSNNSTPDPVISEISPESGPPGTMVTIKGSGFLTDVSAITVTFNSIEAEIISATETEIQAVVPDGAKSGAINIKIGEASVSGPSFMVEEKAPGISSIKPDSGVVGTEVTINGMNFDNSLSGNVVSFNGVEAQIVGATTDQLITKVPEGATDGSVEVIVGDKTAKGPVFDVITTGSLQVNILTTAFDDIDPDGYTLALDGKDETKTAVNDTIFFNGIEQGNYNLELSGLSNNCEFSVSNNQNITITPSDTLFTGFEVTCNNILNDNQLVFSREEGAEHLLYEIDPDGSNLHQITSSGDGYTYVLKPSVSPDRSKILFAARVAAADNYKLYRVDMNGQNIAVIYFGGNVTGRFSWSPDGNQIVFASEETGFSEIYTMTDSGGNLTQITDYQVYSSSPNWSPDGSKIVFASRRDGDRDIYVMDPDGSNRTQLTDNPGRDRYPVWSPDGTKIAFENNGDGDGEIFVMDADGSNLIQITDNDVDDIRPTWSPDGTQIAFIKNRDLFKMNADGSGSPIHITNDNVWDDFPFWKK